MKTSLGVLHLMLVEQPPFDFPRTGRSVRRVTVEWDDPRDSNQRIMTTWDIGAPAAAFVEDVCPGHMADHKEPE